MEDVQAEVTCATWLNAKSYKGGPIHSNLSSKQIWY